MASFLAVTGSFSLTTAVAETVSLANQTFNPSPSLNVSVAQVNNTSGTANAIDVHYEDVNVTLAAGANKVYTLSNLVDLAQRIISCAGGVLEIVLVITSRTAGDKLTFGPNSSNGWTAYVATGTIPVYNTLAVLVDKTDRLAVTAGVSDQLKIANTGANPITYSLMIKGNKT